MSDDELLSEIRRWQADDEQGYDTAINLLCRAADTIEALQADLKANAAMLARQTDLAREAETARANAEAYARESAASRSRLILQVQELEAELADARMLLQPGGPK